MGERKNKNKYVLGIDQSYKRTGITLMRNKEVIKTYSLDYKNCKTNTEKRMEVQATLQAIVEMYLDDDLDNLTVICERIRLKSQGFINENYIKATGALIATIIDYFATYDIPVYSVDTRAWKSAIVGTSKPKENPYGIDPNKYPTIVYLRHLGHLNHIAYKYSGKGKKGVINVKIGGEKVPCKINDDVADSICIAMYGFLPKGKQKLKEETF